MVVTAVLLVHRFFSIHLHTLEPGKNPHPTRIRKEAARMLQVARPYAMQCDTEQPPHVGLSGTEDIPPLQVDFETDARIDPPVAKLFNVRDPVQSCQTEE